MSRILVVDDEPDLCEILKFNLENNGFEVDTANSAEEAMGYDLSVYDLFMLDVMMDKMSGFAFASYLRKNPETSQSSIIFVTAKDSENDALTGFNVGADDYIRKPFGISEVVFRVKAVMRRFTRTSPAVGAELAFADLVLNPDTKRATLAGADLSLTKKEFELLYIMLKKPGRVYSRQELLGLIWPNDANVLERSVDVNIARMRKKLGVYASYIVSRSGYGYCFDKSATE
ncbi:MAG: response regulator transcription factor [Bacteroidaceae bacterium]|nr:response regulator transcription factor [Bacteroidaceae bacterium]MBR5891468.1 response regulator transcription factor [Bacteroidaceae bacterium]